jgi:hypothetical protein
MDGDFGVIVAALLDTFKRCLRTLKRADRTELVCQDFNEKGSSRLQKSIRLDQKRVREAYLSHLSLAGEELELGDCRWLSRSS